MILRRKIHPSNSSKSWSDPWFYSTSWPETFACAVSWSGWCQWSKSWALGWFLNRSWGERNMTPWREAP